MKNDLEEKVATKNLDVVTCDNLKCDIRGDYWKCYLRKEAICPIYIEYMISRLHSNS